QTQRLVRLDESLDRGAHGCALRSPAIRCVSASTALLSRATETLRLLIASSDFCARSLACFAASVSPSTLALIVPQAMPMVVSGTMMAAQMPPMTPIVLQRT